MKSTPESAGSMLRRIRKQRGLTLEQAAERLSISSAAVSRMETDKRKIGREDIRSAVTAYEMTRWEEYYLYISAGLMPDSPPDEPETTFRAFAIQILTTVPYPGFMLDSLGFILAWNGGIQAIWNPPIHRRLHMLEDLFNERVREAMGETWRTYVTRAMWLYYLRSLAVAKDPTFLEHMMGLEQKLGPEFGAMWTEAQNAGYWLSGPPVDGGGVTVSYRTPAGLVTYVVMQSMFRSPTMFDLYLYVPFGRENMELHERFHEMVEINALYTAPTAPSDHSAKSD